MREKTNKIIAVFGEKIQALCAVEELGELQQPLLKFANRGVPKVDVANEVLSEVADVTIMLEQIKTIFGLTDEVVDQMIEYKLERTLGKIKRNCEFCGVDITEIVLNDYAYITFCKDCFEKTVAPNA